MSGEKENLQVCPATKRDLPSLFSLIHLCFRGEAALKGWTTETGIIGGNRITLDQLEQDMDQEGIQFLKCLDKEENVIGLVYGLHDQAAREMKLGMLCVHPDYQSKGVGRKLVTAVENMAKAKHCRSVTMTVINVRDALIAWYERLGFVRTPGKVVEFPKESSIYGTPLVPGLHMIQMEKSVE